MDRTSTTLALIAHSGAAVGAYSYGWQMGEGITGTLSVGRDDGTANVVFCQDGQQTIADYSSGTAAGSPSYTYIYGSYIDEPVLRTDSSGGKLYYHRNQQYSIVALTDSTGTIVERYAYTAYGAPTVLDGAGTALSGSTNRYTYTGRGWDEVLSLYHYRARMYSPIAGRFGSRDPIGYQNGLSLYSSYIGLAYIDPLGTQLISPPSGGGGNGGPGEGPDIPFLPGGDSCTFSVCSSPVAGGAAPRHSDV